jgi:hypothetical protein
MMKAIAYTRPDGGLSICRPSSGARLASSITLADGTVLRADPSQPVDLFMRGWPIEGATAEWAETEEEFLARIIARDVPPDATNVTVVDGVPADRAFRAAWRVIGAVIDHDMPVARTLLRDLLRQERGQRFLALDGLWMRSIARGENAIAAAIEAKREAMRNWPTDPRIPDCTDVPSLRALIETMKAEVA